MSTGGFDQRQDRTRGEPEQAAPQTAEHATERTSPGRAALRDSSFEEGVEALAPDVAPPSPAADIAADLAQMALEPTVTEEVEGEGGTRKRKRRPGSDALVEAKRERTGGGPTHRKVRAEDEAEAAAAREEALWLPEDGAISLDVPVAWLDRVRPGARAEGEASESAAGRKCSALMSRASELWADALTAAQTAPRAAPEPAPEAPASEKPAEPTVRRATGSRPMAARMQMRWEAPARRESAMVQRYGAVAGRCEAVWKAWLSADEAAQPRGRGRRRRKARSSRVRTREE